MSSVIKKLVDAGRRFTAMDFAVFKVCLLAVGVLLGAYLSRFFLHYIAVVWIIAIAAWLLLITRVIRYYDKRDQS